MRTERGKTRSAKSIRVCHIQLAMPSQRNTAWHSRMLRGSCAHPRWPGYLREDTGWCGPCTRPRQAKDPPRACAGCGQVKRHEGLGLCSACWQRRPERPLVQGAHLVARPRLAASVCGSPPNTGIYRASWSLSLPFNAAKPNPLPGDGFPMANSPSSTPAEQRRKPVKARRLKNAE